MLDAREKQELAGLLIEKDRRQLVRSLPDYTREAWKILEPASPLVDNWYVDAITEHLQAAFNGDIHRLVINQPPQTGKSNLVSRIFPTWGWANNPALKWMFYTYNFKGLTEPMNVQRRNILLSPWWQERWGHTMTLAADESMKWRFVNDKTGHMTAATGATGIGADFLIVDDLHSASEAWSEAERTAGVTFFRNTLMSRLTPGGKNVCIIVAQRLHEKDVCGEVLKDGGWEHLCLPATAEGQQTIFLPLSGRKWVRKKGELLDEQRLPKKELKAKETELGSRGFAGQYQQRPAPATGIIFRPDWWQYRKNFPEFEMKVISVDAAFKENRDDVAIQCWGTVGISSFLIEKDTTPKGYIRTKAAIREMFKRNSTGCGVSIVLIEDKANGSAICEELKTEFPVKAVEPAGGKVARAEACSPDVEAKNVFLPEGASWVTKFVHDCTLFPAGDDHDVDAMTQFLNWRRGRSHGLLEWYKKQAAAEEVPEPGETKVSNDDPMWNPALAMMHESIGEAGRMGRSGAKLEAAKGIAKIQTGEKTPVCQKCSSLSVMVSAVGQRCNACGYVTAKLLEKTSTTFGSNK